MDQLPGLIVLLVSWIAATLATLAISEAPFLPAAFVGFLLALLATPPIAFLAGGAANLLNAAGITPWRRAANRATRPR